MNYFGRVPKIIIQADQSYRFALMRPNLLMLPNINYKLLKAFHSMLTFNNHHHCQQAPSIVHIPKPLQRCKKFQQSFRASQLDGEIQNLSEDPAVPRLTNKACKQQVFERSMHSSTFIIGYSNHKFIKAQAIEMAKPEGDLSQSPGLALSELEFNPPSAASSHKKPNFGSNTRLRQTKKPSLDQRNTPSIACENEVLKRENQKLKHLSELRKNKIEILLREISTLKCELSYVFEGFQAQEFNSLKYDLNSEMQYSKQIYNTLKEELQVELANQLQSSISHKTK